MINQQQLKDSKFIHDYLLDDSYKHQEDANTSKTEELKTTTDSPNPSKKTHTGDLAENFSNEKSAPSNKEDSQNQKKLRPFSEGNSSRISSSLTSNKK